MIYLILAQGGGIEDWMQIIIVIVVIAFSVLGQISKTLIEKFSPKDGEGKTPRRSTPPADEGTPPRPPAAKPAPPRAQRPSAAQPARPVRPAPPRPTAPQAARPRRAVPRPPSPSVAQTTPPIARPPGGEKRGPAAPQRPAPEDEPSLQRRHLAHLTSGLDHEGEIIETEVSDHIRHVEGDLTTVADETLGIDGVDAFERPSRAALRRAVVLSEMLAPPLGLRERTDRW